MTGYKITEYNFKELSCLNLWIVQDTCIVSFFNSVDKEGQGWIEVL